MGLFKHWNNIWDTTLLPTWSYLIILNMPVIGETIAIIKLEEKTMWYQLYGDVTTHHHIPFQALIISLMSDGKNNVIDWILASYCSFFDDEHSETQTNTSKVHETVIDSYCCYVSYRWSCSKHYINFILLCFA